MNRNRRRVSYFHIASHHILLGGSFCDRFPSHVSLSSLNIHKYCILRWCCSHSHKTRTNKNFILKFYLNFSVALLSDRTIENSKTLAHTERERTSHVRFGIKKYESYYTLLCLNTHTHMSLLFYFIILMF